MSEIGNRKSPIGNPASAASVDADNPWPGLASFTEDARAFFFGREKETDELSRLVRRQTLTVLFGQSGLGKSSLLQAGLFPLLRATDHLPLYLRLDHSLTARAPVAGLAEAGPGSASPATVPPLVDQVKAALHAAFAEARADAPAFRSDETLWEYFHRKDVDIWSAKNRLLTPVLAFDQFEEIFTLGRADETCRERSRVFLSELACLVENRPPPAVQARLDAGELDPARFNFEKPSCQVILSLREDFLPDLEGLKQEMPALIHNRLRLKKLSGTQALEIVSQPAPHLLAEGVAERIVEFVAGGRGGSAERLSELDVEPPLLSVICRELNDRRRALGQAQITTDLVSGNRREILTDFYDRSIADLPEAMRVFVEDKLLTKSGFRDNLALESALDEPGVTRPLIDTLVSRRLLRIEDRLGVQRVELTHDVLADVIRASRDARQQRLAATTAARHARRLRWVVAGLALIVVGLSIGAVFGIRAQHLAAVRASRTDLTLASRMLNGGQAAEGVAYAVRAARTDPRNPAVGPRLLSALASRSFLLPDRTPYRLPSGVRQIAYTPDGSKLFVLGTDGAVRVLDAADGRILHTFTFTQKAGRFGFFRDNPNRFFIILADRKTVLVCDANNGQPVGPPISPPDRITLGDFSPDGRWLVAGNFNDVWIWNVSSGERREITHEPSITGATFSPDGTRLAIVEYWGMYIFSTPDGKPLGGTQVKIPSFGGSFSPDGRQFAVLTRRGIQLCDVATGRVVLGPLLNGFSHNPPRFTPDGKRVMELCDDGFVRVWDTATGRLAYPPLPCGTDPSQLELSRDGRVAVSVGGDGYTYFFDLAAGRALTEPTLQRFDSPQVALAPDGRHAVVGTSTGLVFPLRPGDEAARPLVFPVKVRNDRIPRWAFLPVLPERLSHLTDQGQVVSDAVSGRETPGGFTVPTSFHFEVVSSDHRTAIVSDRAQNQPEDQPVNFQVRATGTDSPHFVPMMDLPASWVYTRFSADGSRFLPVPPKENQRTFRVWDTHTGRPVSPEMTAAGTIYWSAAGSFSPDDRRVATGSVNGHAQVWDVATGKVVFDLHPLPEVAINFVLFSPDGSRIATTSVAGDVRFWNAATGRPASAVLQVNSYVNTATFSPDGRYFAVGPDSGIVQIWDARDGTPVGQPLVHQGGVNSIAFNADGSRIVTGSSDRTARVWDTRTGLPLTEPLVHPSSVTTVSFSPGPGRFVMTKTAEDTYVWSVPPAGGGAPVPPWLSELASLTAGKHVTDNGVVENVSNDTAKVDALRSRLAALPDNAPYVKWGRWLLADRDARSIAPGFTITPAEARKLAHKLANDAAAKAGP